MFAVSAIVEGLGNARGISIIYISHLIQYMYVVYNIIISRIIIISNNILT